MTTSPLERRKPDCLRIRPANHQGCGGRRIAFHGGDALGGRAFLLAYPDDGLILAMTSNLGLAQFAEKEAMLIAEPFLQRPH